jgi:hypothetical protein
MFLHKNENKTFLPYVVSLESVHDMQSSSLRGRSSNAAAAAGKRQQSKHLLFSTQMSSMRYMGGSHGGITGVEDSQETMLPETYNNDPAATQRVQLVTTSGHLMLTFPDDDSPSQLSSVAGTPREQYTQNRSMRFMAGSRGGITGVEDSQLSSVAGTPREQYHVQNSWEADHDHSDSAVHFLSVAGTPQDFSMVVKQA